MAIDQYLEDKVVHQRLKDLSHKFSQMDGVVIGTTSSLSLPPAMERFSTQYNLPEATSHDYLTLVKRILRDLKERSRVKISLNKNEASMLIEALRGLTMREADKILTQVIIEDDSLQAGDIQKVIRHKRDIISREGLLEYYPVEDSKMDIADLKTLRSWLEKRKKIITNPKKAKDFGLEFPKGILLLGVQGCGKSLCAKVVSKEWGLPLMRLDPSNLYDKYVGESEKNFKKAMKVAEAMAACYFMD